LNVFFEELLLLIRNKVLLIHGDLKQTKLTWLFPSSMSGIRLDELDTLWRKLFAKYITTKNVPQKLSESIAPYYYYKHSKGINAADKPVVGIDIGGGTSDIVIYQGKKTSSFKFNPFCCKYNFW
jgi:hypothetical protein